MVQHRRIAEELQTGLAKIQKVGNDNYSTTMKNQLETNLCCAVTAGSGRTGGSRVNSSRDCSHGVTITTMTTQKLKCIWL